MRQTMQPNSMQARVAGQYFKGITRRRITVEYTLDIFTHTFKHAHLDVVQFHRAQLSEFRSKYHAKYSLQIFSIGCAQKYGATVPLNALAWQGQENQSQPKCPANADRTTLKNHVWPAPHLAFPLLQLPAYESADGFLLTTPCAPHRSIPAPQQPSLKN